MKLREVLTKILNKTDLELTSLLARMELLEDYQLLLEIERLWSRMTGVKVASNVLVDELGLKPDSKRVIVVLTSNLRMVEALSLKYPGCVVAHADDKDKFYELMSYFNLWSSINFILVERPYDLSLIRFSHFAARIANYFEKREDVGFYILAPADEHDHYNPYFINRDNIITDIQKLP